MYYCLRMRQLIEFRQFDRVFYHFSIWEDWKNGFYETGRDDNMSLMSKKVLSNSSDCKAQMMRVIQEWPFSSKQNLTNISLNRNAWLGQAACNISHGSNFIQTIDGWNMMDQMEQVRANKIAEQVIRHFEWMFITEKI